MPTLHMEVEIAKSSNNTLKTTFATLTSTLQSATAAVNNLRGGAWLGPSSVEFFGQYDAWKSKTTTALNDLQTMAGRLTKEIQEWETAASKLSA